MINATMEALPTVGVKGRFSARTPFDTKINPQIEYTCIDVSTIRGLIARGQDPFNEVYVPAGLDDEAADFQQDIDRCIVTLQAGSGLLVKIPSSYLHGQPDNNGVRYVHSMIGVALSVIPEGLDLTSLLQEVTDLVYDRLGVRSEAKVVTLDTVTVLSQQEHNAIETARQTNITRNESNVAKIRRLEVENLELQERLGQLEAYLRSTIT